MKTYNISPQDYTRWRIIFSKMASEKKLRLITSLGKEWKKHGIHRVYLNLSDFGLNYNCKAWYQVKTNGGYFWADREDKSAAKQIGAELYQAVMYRLAYIASLDEEIEEDEDTTEADEYIEDMKIMRQCLKEAEDNLSPNPFDDDCPF